MVKLKKQKLKEKLNNLVVKFEGHLRKVKQFLDEQFLMVKLKVELKMH